MNKVILLILNDEDVAAIPTAIPRLKALAPEGIWIIHNPHLGVTDEKIVQGFDKEITLLNQSIKDAIGREDYDAAKSYKTARESKEMDRLLALREGWKKAPVEKLQEAYAKFLSPFDRTVAANILITTLRDSSDPRDTFSALHALRAQWPPQLQHGSYIVAWPSSLPNGHSPAKPEITLESKPLQAPLSSENQHVGKTKPARKISSWNVMVKKAQDLKVWKYGMTKYDVEKAIEAAERSQPVAA